MEPLNFGSRKIKDHTVSKALELNLLLEKNNGGGNVFWNQMETLKNGWIRPRAGAKKNDSPDF